MSCLRLGDEVGQREIGVGTCNEVGMVILQQIFLNTLCHASQHTDNHLVSLAALGVEGVQAVVYLLLGIVAHRTCVEEHRVGILDVLAGFISSHLHHRRHHF